MLLSHSACLLFIKSHFPILATMTYILFMAFFF